jgi:MoxR-like ATPase
MATSTTSTRQPTRTTDAATSPTRSITAELGLEGWQHLDPVLLASLALEAPLLLVGAHGTAKSLVAERVAGAVDAELRHYNASLLNYDDLVGIPVPADDGVSLEYLGTAGAVWDAEFVFLDEINRCRPDLQNKLFPLVHERRLAGEDLAQLRHRWAAINPPGEIDGHAYLGTEELDAALADRFWFVVPVPGWQQLRREDRVRLVLGGAAVPTGSGTAEEDERPSVLELVAAAAGAAAAVEAHHGESLANYVVSLLDQLGTADIHLSPRRARILLQAVCAVHGALLVTGADDADLGESALLTLLHALPQRASATPVQLAKVIAAHKQAWEVAVVDESGVLQQLLAEQDPVQRVRLAVDRKVDDDLLGRLTVQAVAAQQSEAARAGLAFVFARAFAERPLSPAAWGTIVDAARPILTPVTESDNVPQGERLDRVRRIDAYCAELDDAPGSQLVRAFLQGCRPWLALDDAWRKHLVEFVTLCATFGVQG